MASPEFKEAMRQPSRDLRSRVTLPGMDLDDESIVKIDIDSSLVFGGDFEIGTAPMDTAKVELIIDEGELGRNQILGSGIEKDFDEDIETTVEYYDEFERKDYPWGRTPAPEGSNNLKGTQYNLSTTLKKDQWYTLSVEGAFIEDDFVGVWLGNDKFIGYLDEDNRITFKADEQFDDNYIIVKSLSEEGAINKIWLIEGETPLPWSIAPEDILDYNYEDKEIDIQLGILLEDESIEYVDMGLYTIEKAVKKNNSITLDCVDRMYKAEIDFVDDLLFPTTVLNVLQSACDQSGIMLATLEFANSNYVIPHKPVFEGLTCRQIFAMVAELAGGYAKINRAGDLEILTLGDTSVRDIHKEHYNELDESVATVGSIERLIVKVGDELASRGEGKNIYTVVDNILIQDPNEVIDELYEVLKKVNYTSFEFEWQGDPSLTVGDKITVDGKETYLLDRRLSYTGGLKEEYKAPVKTNIERFSTPKTNLILDMNNIKTQIKVIEGEISQTIEKVENLVVDASNRLYQSQTQIPFELNIGTGSIQLFREAYHPYYKVTSDTNIDLSASFPQSQYAEDLTGEEVTISLDVLVDVDRVVTLDGKEFEVKGNRWTRIHVTKEFPENTTRNTRVRVPYSRQTTRDKIIGNKLIDSLSTDINTIYYRNLQVQKGDVPTNWTLTPEELEGQIDRYQSEIKQLVDSISMMVRKDELSAEFMINADSIVQAINTTDGVGKVKSVKVTVDGNGLTVDDGAVIIRDSNNTAIITSDGIKLIFVYTSSGELNGWQKIGLWNDAGILTQKQAYITVTIPDKFIIENAELITRSLPSRWSGWNESFGVPDGTYHARNMRLFKATDGSNGILDYPFGSSYNVMIGIDGRTDLTNAVWGGQWSPTGNGIREITGNITNHISTGSPQTFGVSSADNLSSSNQRYIGGLQFTLVVEGFLRG